MDVSSARHDGYAVMAMHALFHYRDHDYHYHDYDDEHGIYRHGGVGNGDDGDPDCGVDSANMISDHGIDCAAYAGLPPCGRVLRLRGSIASTDEWTGMPWVKTSSCSM